MLEYASRLEKGPGAVPELRDTESTPTSCVASVEMRWALKQSRSRNIRFTGEQKFLIVYRYWHWSIIVLDRTMREYPCRNKLQMIKEISNLTKMGITMLFVSEKVLLFDPKSFRRQEYSRTLWSRNLHIA